MKFTMVVEGDNGFERELDWSGETLPEVIFCPMGVIYIKGGVYLSAVPDRINYRRPIEAVMVDGRLIAPGGK